MTTPEQLRALLGAEAPRAFFTARRKRFALWALGLLLLVWLLLPGGKKSGGQYITEKAEDGHLVVTVSASGTLQPTKSVDVGSELSGTLAQVLAQENDHVKKGQLLAELDPAKLQDAVNKSRASLASAQAAVAQAQATVAESKANLARMRHVAELSGGKVPAKSDLDSAEAALLRAEANDASAKATVMQAEAALKTDETNLGKSKIRSPVDGVVLTRKVEPGQTVVAAMTIPVLFTIAEDLTRMELQIKVDEADVANVKLGQAAHFTVAAWPGRRFPATLQRVGIGSTITDNVVTYKTVLSVKNDDLALRPGMSASAAIITAQRDKVLLVPNAALRFSPPKAPEEKKAQGSFVSNLLPRPPHNDLPRPAAANGNAPQVWMLDSNNQPQALAVTVGVSNGRHTEITGGELKAGMAVITDYQDVKR